MTKMPVVDRSRLVEGMGRCEHKRYLEYDYLGTGIKPKGQFIPLATGSSVHEAIAGILLDSNNPDGFDWSIQKAVTSYQVLVQEKGFYQVEDQSKVEEIVQEQSWLIECLGWAFVRVYLPWILNDFEILCAEREETLVLGCSCGLKGVWAAKGEHENRDCQGICLMSRPDLILQRKGNGEILSLDIKTVGDPGYSWRMQWEDNLQLLLQLAATEQRLEKPIMGSYVIGLVKGKRDKVFYKDDNSPLFQNSPLCYAYVREDPFTDIDIKYFYDYVDEEGMNRKATASKGYNKTAAWKISQDAKEWVFKMPEEVLQKVAVLLGPFSRPQQELIDKTLIGIYGNEVRWNQKLMALAEQGKEYLDYYFPKSWECRRYNSVCPMIKVCKEGMEDPLGSGMYEARVANHPLEDEA